MTVTPLTPDPHQTALEECLQRYLESTDPIAKAMWWNEYRALHAQRPAEVVARMERERGLA